MIVQNLSVWQPEVLGASGRGAFKAPGGGPFHWHLEPGRFNLPEVLDDHRETIMDHHDDGLRNNESFIEVQH